MEELIEELKSQIIEALNLDNITEGDIDIDAPLFGNEGIGLDSIDALEIIVLLEKNYGIRLASAEEGKKVFGSIRSIAEFVSSYRTK